MSRAQHEKSIRRSVGSNARKFDTAVADLIHDHGLAWLTDEQIADIRSELIRRDWRSNRNALENRAEAAWLAQQERLMESGGPDDSAYRRDMQAAGRGHLLGG